VVICVHFGPLETHGTDGVMISHDAIVVVDRSDMNLWIMHTEAAYKPSSLQLGLSVVSILNLLLRSLSMTH
jgi:hypothetical protein